MALFIIVTLTRTCFPYPLIIISAWIFRMRILMGLPGQKIRRIVYGWALNLIYFNETINFSLWTLIIKSNFRYKFSHTRSPSGASRSSSKKSSFSSVKLTILEFKACKETIGEQASWLYLFAHSMLCSMILYNVYTHTNTHTTHTNLLLLGQ